MVNLVNDSEIVSMNAESNLNPSISATSLSVVDKENGGKKNSGKLKMMFAKLLHNGSGEKTQGATHKKKHRFWLKHNNKMKLAVTN